MKEVLISVNIVTYNRANTILRAVDSVLKQTYKWIEVIVVDDGSTDSTAQILGDYSNGEVKYFKLPKRGKSFCREFARKASKGQFIAFLDSDDFWMPRYLQKSVFFLENYNLDILFSRSYNHLYSPDNKIITLYSYSEIRNLVQRLCPAPTSGMIIRSSLIGFEWDVKHNTYEDWHLQTRLIFLNSSLKVGYNSEVLWHKYEDESTYIKRASTSFLKERLCATRELNSFLKDKVNFKEGLLCKWNETKDSYRVIKSYLHYDSN